MGIAEEKLATQIGSKGYFGKVTLHAEPAETGDIRVEFDPNHAENWQNAARFGIEYALEHVAKHKLFPKGGRIFVSHIGGHPVDTNSVVIAFVAANAVFKALGIEPPTRPNFDPTTGVFNFPK